MSVRAQYREQARHEAKRIALEQLAESGPSGVSVNAIAKRMGVTGPALYRYFASRDDLLTELIAEVYTDLAEIVEEAAAAATRRAPGARLRSMAEAMRNWAVAQPHRYLLLFGTQVPGYRAPRHTIAAAHRTVVAFATAFADLGEPPPPGRLSPLDRQFAELVREQAAQVGLHALRRAVLGWTRLHGVLSLELAGQFDLMGLDPALLFHAEVDALIAGE